MNKIISWIIFILALHNNIHCIPFQLNQEPTTNSDDTVAAAAADSSIYGNTDETFFDFANRRVNELKLLNENLFDKSIGTCPYTPLDTDLNNNIKPAEEIVEEEEEETETNNNNKKCMKSSLILNYLRGKTADRIFLIDETTFGVISSADSSVSFYNLNDNFAFNHMRTKVFRNQVPYDGCADSARNIFIAFPEQNKISKYNLNQSTLNYKINSIDLLKNKTNFILKEVYSIRDADFKPTSISCNNDYVYVSERAKSQIRVYDSILRLIRIINLNGVIVSSHSALAVDQNVRVFSDGLDGVALFNPRNTNAKQQQLNSLLATTNRMRKVMSEVSRVNVCHFYKNMNCIEDVDVYTEEKFKSSIYVVDSCDNDIKQFFYSREEKIYLAKKFKIGLGKPISSIRTHTGYLIVLTNSPAKLNLLDAKECP
jgi:hypothetical protein